MASSGPRRAGRSPSRRGLRSYVRRELRALDAPSPLDLQWLCDEIGRRRGRAITLTPAPLPVPGAFGLWIATADEDVVFFQSETTPTHQNHIILHELGHIMAGHEATAAEGGADDAPADDAPAHGAADADGPQERVVAELLPDLPTELVATALRRETYDDVHEQEAELVASTILEWSSLLGLTSPPTPSDATSRRAQDALGDRQGWL